MDSTQRLLAGLLVVQVALIGVIRWASSSGHSAAGEHPLLPALASTTPRKLEIDDGKNSVALERESGSWTLAEPKGYPIAAGRVEKLVQDLGHLSVSRPVVTNRLNHAALKVAANDYERRVRIWEKPQGQPIADVFVGTSPGFGVSHVRLGGKDPVYEGNGLNAYDLATDAGSWVERGMVPIAWEAVGGLSVTNRKGSFQLEKSGGRWSARSPTTGTADLDPEKVDALGRALCALSLDEPVGPVDEQAQGLNDPEATIVFQPAAGDSAAATQAPVTIKIGALVPGKEDQRYAARSGFAYAVSVSKFSSERALSVTLKELLATAKTAEAAGTPKPGAAVGK